MRFPDSSPVDLSENFTIPLTLKVGIFGEAAIFIASVTLKLAGEHGASIDLGYAGLAMGVVAVAAGVTSTAVADLRANRE